MIDLGLADAGRSVDAADSGDVVVRAETAQLPNLDRAGAIQKQSPHVFSCYKCASND